MSLVYRLFKLEELYPYLFGTPVDTWRWGYNIQIDKINSSFFNIELPIIHFNLLLQQACNTSHIFQEMGLTTLNYVHNRTSKGPFPFSELSPTSNFFPETNPDSTEPRKAYYSKY
jgi:hypothetical protein